MCLCVCFVINRVYCCDGPFATCYEHSVLSYPLVTPLNIRNSPQSGILHDPEDPIIKDKRTHIRKPLTVTTEESHSHTRSRTPSHRQNFIHLAVVSLTPFAPMADVSDLHLRFAERVEHLLEHGDVQPVSYFTILHFLRVSEMLHRCHAFDGVIFGFIPGDPSCFSQLTILPVCLFVHLTAPLPDPDANGVLPQE